VDAVREVARSTQAVLIDHYAAWLEQETSGKLPYWLSDAIHPNEMGHRAMNRLLLQQLGLWRTDGITSKLLIA
jgi:lysophospholipase L1-like esterase